MTGSSREGLAVGTTAAVSEVASKNDFPSSYASCSHASCSDASCAGVSSFKIWAGRLSGGGFLFHELNRVNPQLAANRISGGNALYAQHQQLCIRAGGEAPAYLLPE